VNTLIVTDLDGTVLFSPRSLVAGDDGLKPVDVHEGRTLASMTAAATHEWIRLVRTGALVPATTRSVPQYLRLRLPGPIPRLAIVCNGARLLVDGVPDPDWERRMRRRMRRSATFDLVWKQVTSWYGRHPFAALRAVDDLFMYLAVHERTEWLTGFAAAAATWTADVGWQVSLQGHKLYLLPAALDKAAACAHVAERLDADRVVAGGDSLLDLGMLQTADAAIRPAHGELHLRDVALPGCRVTQTSGARAGDEILRWYARQVLPASPGAPANPC
jgi:hydroxymethylpyrimidine pyrophosphatase-like HAD family hydrolase